MGLLYYARGWVMQCGTRSRDRVPLRFPKPAAPPYPSIPAPHQGEYKRKTETKTTRPMAGNVESGSRNWQNLTTWQPNVKPWLLWSCLRLPASPLWSHSYPAAGISLQPCYRTLSGKLQHLPCSPLFGQCRRP